MSLMFLFFSHAGNVTECVACDSVTVLVVDVRKVLTHCEKNFLLFIFC